MMPLSIYLHVPFCVKKCNYCDFLSFPQGTKDRENYVKLLIEEIALMAPKYRDYTVVTVFLGGGTPSLLSPAQLGRIMDSLKASFCIDKNAEISMEVNPGTASKDAFVAYHRMGINRISFGLQSTVEEELQMLGRIHTYDQFLEAYQAAVAAGFTNCNVDLMAAVPSQSLTSYEETINRVLALSPAPAHISAYSLIVEEGTPFFQWHKEGHLTLPSEEEEREMYVLTEKKLKQAGYERYEISNYAKKGYACKHNQVYWNRENYLGFGLGAASMVENVRWSNEQGMTDYERRVKQKSFVLEKQVLSKEEQMEEFMFLGLRLTEGVSFTRFAECFGCPLENVYGQVVEKHKKEGLLECAGDKLRLTKKGLDVSNYVMADFLF